MAHSYRVFGLRVCSNEPIPGLVDRQAELNPDLRIWLGVPPPWRRSPVESAEPWYASRDRGEEGIPNLQTWKLELGGYSRFLYGDGAEFFFDSAGTELWAIWPAQLTIDDVTPYLLGNVLGFIQRLRGITCLHASAVEDHGRAFALLGPARAGKSTCAATFFRLGYRVLADDVVPVLESNGDFFAQPSHPRIWLCGDIVRSLYGSEESLPILTPSWEKRYIDMNSDGMSFEDEPVPMMALYLLGERTDEPRAPYLEPVSQTEALMTLVANTYVNLLIDQTMRAREFELLGRLAVRLPVRRIRPHVDPARLPNLCQVVLDDFRTSPAPSFAVYRNERT